MKITETKPTIRTFSLEVTPDEIAVLVASLLDSACFEKGGVDEGHLYDELRAFADENDIDLETD